MSRILFPVGILFLAVGCGPERALDTFEAPESARVVEGTPEAALVLDVANYQTLDVLDIDAALDVRAARNIITFRSGPDGVLGSLDDVQFETLTELDDIAYVGPSALDKLLLWGESNQVHGLLEGGPEAAVVLDLANRGSFAVLDDDARLDVRAVRSITEARSVSTLTSLAELDGLGYVGASAFEKLLDFGITEGFGEGVCFEDGQGPNHDAESAIEAFDGLQGTAISGVSDFYTVVVQPGERIDFGVQFFDRAGDVDLRLTTPDGVLRSTSVSDDESVAWINSGEEPVELLAEVYLWQWSNLPCNTYTLDVAYSEALCPDSVLDNHTLEDAVFLPYSDRQLGLAPGEEDFYTVYIGADNAAFFLVPQGADIDLFEADGTPVPGNPGSNNAHVYNRDTFGKTYVMRITEPSLEEGTCLDYQVTSQIDRAPCEMPDWSESLSGPITDAEASDLWVSRHDVDVFSYDVPAGGELSVSLYWQTRFDDVQSHFVGPDGLEDHSNVYRNTSGETETVEVVVSLANAPEDGYTCAPYSIDARID